MERTEHRAEPWTTHNQRRGALIVLAICVLLAAAITAALMRVDRAPVQQATPKVVDEVAMLRAERADIERIPLEPTASVSLGW